MSFTDGFTSAGAFNIFKSSTPNRRRELAANQGDEKVNGIPAITTSESTPRRAPSTPSARYQAAQTFKPTFPVLSPERQRYIQNTLNAAYRSAAGTIIPSATNLVDADTLMTGSFLQVFVAAFRPAHRFVVQNTLDAVVERIGVQQTLVLINDETGQPLFQKLLAHNAVILRADGKTYWRAALPEAKRGLLKTLERVTAYANRR